MTDLITKPAHYAQHPSGVESIKVAELGGFYLGNAIKYLFRYKHKGTPRADLFKARYYLLHTNEERAELPFYIAVNPASTADWLEERVIPHEPTGTPLWWLLSAVTDSLRCTNQHQNALGMAVYEIERELEKYPETPQTLALRAMYWVRGGINNLIQRMEKK